MRLSRAAESKMIWLTAICFLMVCLLADSAPAQTTQSVEPSIFDSKAIKPPSRAVATQADAKPANAFDWQRLLMALGIVLGLIIALKFLVGKMYPGLSSGSKSRIVKVLSRSPIAPKQQVILLQVGRRIVVVGDSGGQMGTLSEITDPDEVASLIGQVESTELIAAPKTMFSNLFGKARQDYDEPVISEPRFERNEEPNSEINAAQTEISGLIDRMRALTKVVRREE